MNLNEASKYSGVDPRTIRKAIDRGWLNAEKEDNGRIWKIDDLDLESCLGPRLFVGRIDQEVFVTHSKDLKKLKTVHEHFQTMAGCMEYMSMVSRRPDVIIVKS